MCVQRPVAIASATVVNAALKYELRHAAALAGSAVMAGRAAVQRPASDSRRGRCVTVRPSFSFHAIAQPHLRAGACAIGGRKWPSGSSDTPSAMSADPDVVLDEVVVRRHVRVPERPVVAVAVERCRLEIEIAEAIALSGPDVGAPADDPHPSLPAERLVRPASCTALRDRWRTSRSCAPCRRSILLPRPRAADDFGRAVAILAARRPACARGSRQACARRPASTQRDLQAGLGQPLRRPAARGARSDDDDVELVLRSGVHAIVSLLNSTDPAEGRLPWQTPGPSSAWAVLRLRPRCART